MLVNDHHDDTDVTGNDFLTPRTMELVKTMDLNDDTLDRTQLAILALIPEQERLLATMKVTTGKMEAPQNMEHIRNQLMQNAAKSRKDVVKSFAQNLVAGSFALRYLEKADIPEGAISDFQQLDLRDPVKVAESVPNALKSGLEEVSSATSGATQGAHAGEARRDVGVQQQRARGRRGCQADRFADREAPQAHPELSTSALLHGGHQQGHSQRILLLPRLADRVREGLHTPPPSAPRNFFVLQPFQSPMQNVGSGARAKPERHHAAIRALRTAGRRATLGVEGDPTASTAPTSARRPRREPGRGR